MSTIIRSFIAIFLLVSVFFLRNAAVAQSNNKVTICHATGSATNPYVQIVTSENGINGHFENNGTPKAGHEQDLLFQGEVACPGGSNPTSQPTPTNIIENPCDGECFPTISIPTIITPTVSEDQGDENNGNINLPCLFQRCITPTPTSVVPTATATPSPTLAPTAAPTSKPTEQGGTGGSSSQGSSSPSSSSSSSQGEVLGTSTMASTGTFTDSVMNLVFVAGVFLIGLSAKRYAQEVS